MLMNVVRKFSIISTKNRKSIIELKACIAMDSLGLKARVKGIEKQFQVARAMTNRSQQTLKVPD